MRIRKADQNEMMALWGNKNPAAGGFFYHILQDGTAEFWAIEHRGALIGELYAVYNLEDKDFADGKQTVYLCAFRIRKDYRCQGLGTRLMLHVLEHIKAQGYRRVTIGVDAGEEANIRLYRRLGFTQKIKDCTIDPCDRDEQMQPKPCPLFWLLYQEI